MKATSSGSPVDVATPGGAAGSWKRMLLARPVRNAAESAEVDSEGCATIQIKTAKPWYMVPPLSWIVPVRPKRGVMLDRIGTQIWQLCDGEKTVEEVIDAFAARHRLTFHEARAAVTSYVKTLVQRGVLAIVSPKEQEQ